jgi:SAM-dependent methyltransferase
MEQTMEQYRFPKRPCPVCRSERSKQLFRQSFAHLSGATLLEGYRVVICEDCGAGFADDIPPQSLFDQYYRDLSKYETTGSPETAPVVDQRFRDIASLIAPFIPSGDSRILEIGSAAGGLLRALMDLGFCNVTGADPSPECVRVAHEAFGVPGVVATILRMPAADEPYDTLITTGVFEHIRDLEGAVSEVRRLIRPGGRVYLEVPDASRYQPQQDAPYQEFSVEHVNYFSLTSLRNLMQQRGFTAIAGGHVVRPQHEITCPCVYGVFELSDRKLPLERDTETEAGLTAYIAGCAAEDSRIRAAIGQALRPGERMIVWGTGAHTLRLLATGGLDPATISVFVDSNPKYQQRTLNGIPVVGPADLKARTEPILISSCGFQNEIREQVQQGLGLTNPLILLY